MGTEIVTLLYVTSVVAVEKEIPSVGVIVVVSSSSSEVATVVVGTSVKIFMTVLSVCCVQLVLTFYCNPIRLCYESKLCSILRICSRHIDLIDTRISYGRA